MDTSDRIVDVSIDGGTMGTFVAQPTAEGHWPGVAIGIEGFGLTEHIRGVARRLAAEGFLVVIPDLFHRQGRFLTAPYTDYDGARRLMRAVPDVEMLVDMDAALAYLTTLPDCRDANVGLVGYRVGGRWALATACRRPNVKAVVSYYGNITAGDMAGQDSPPPMDLIDSLQAAALLLWGDGEPLSRAEVHDVVQRLQTAGKACDSVIYDGTHRGFDVPEDPYYSAAAAQDAWTRTVAWLHRYLGA
jgi:carboxymethylenebutenolidase